MKKATLAITLLFLFGVCVPLASASVSSPILKVTQKNQTYYDPATIRKKGDNKVSLWVLDDYASLQQSQDGRYYNSQKTLYEFNCKENKLNILAIVSFSGNMGKGDVVYSNDFSENESLALSAIGHDRRDKLNLEFACGIE